VNLGPAALKQSDGKYINAQKIHQPLYKHKLQFRDYKIKVLWELSPGTC